MRASWLSSSCPSCLHTRFHFLVSPAPTDLHTGTTKNYHPTTTVQQQEPVPPSPHFHLVATTRQIISTCLTPEPPLLFFWAYINTTRNGGSKNSTMIAIVTDTFATSMQPYPSQPHLSRRTHLLLKTVSIGLSHMESPTGFPYISHFTLEPILSVTSYFFFFFFFIRTLQTPSKNK